MGLTKRKDGWYVEFSVVDDGKFIRLGKGIPGAKLRRWKACGTTKTMAKQHAAKIHTELVMDGMKSERESSSMTFQALARIYLDTHTVQKHNTYPWKKAIIEKRFLPFFGKLSLNEVSPLKIEKFRDQRLQDVGNGGTTLKVATINRNLALLKAIFSLAIREGWLERNPVSLIKLGKENNVRDRVLEPEEFDRLQTHSALHLQAINLCAYQTGMRSGEILTLTWDRVDFQAGLIRLRAEDTKTDDARLIPLTRELTVLLKNLYKVRYLDEQKVFLVKGRSIGSMKTAFKGACRRAGIDGFNFHDFRHTAVTNMRRAGIDHLTIMKITGHKTMAVFKRYNSFRVNDLKQAASQFNTYLTLAHTPQVTDSPNSLILKDAPVAQLDRASAF